MKTFVVFASMQYYPYGGMDDCKLVTGDLEEAKAKVQELKEEEYADYDEIRIVAFEDGKQVAVS